MIFWYILQLGLWKDVEEQSQRTGDVVKDIACPSDDDWQEMFLTATKHALCGLFFEGCSCLKTNWKIPKSVFFQLSSLFMQAESGNRDLNNILSKCVQQLDNQGVRYCLLKGQGLAKLYANPYARQSGDIDLYVATEQEKALKVLLPLSETKRFEVDGKHTSIKIQGREVELHKWADSMPNKFKNSSFWRWSDEELFCHADTIEIEDTSVNVPPVTYNVFYVFHHLLRHFLSSGIGLRQFCDLARLVHTQYEHIDQELLKEKLREYGLTSGWDVVMGVLVKYLGLRRDEAIVISKINWKACDRMISMVMNEGNFGHYGSMRGRPLGRWAGKWFYFKVLTQRSSRLMRILPQITFVYYTNYLLFGGLGIFRKE